MQRVDEQIRAACAHVGLTDVIRRCEPVSGGCMYGVRRVTVTDETVVAVKIGGRDDHGIFAEEAAGLRAIAQTNSVRVPDVMGIWRDSDAAILVLQWIEHGSANAGIWATFGEQLAALHTWHVGDRYGFDHDNHLGRTPQPNAWCDDWVEFNQEHRLGHQLSLAQRDGRIDAPFAARVQRLIDRLDQHIPRRPPPALLHGDLWSGNALPTRDGAVAVIDPACSIGDGWADIAMMELFGGFPETCMHAYRAHAAEQEAVDERIAVYQLYHVLNHVNLFGGSYVESADRLLRRIGY